MNREIVVPSRAVPAQFTPNPVDWFFRQTQLMIPYGWIVLFNFFMSNYSALHSHTLLLFEIIRTIILISHYTFNKRKFSNHYKITHFILVCKGTGIIHEFGIFLFVDSLVNERILFKTKMKDGRSTTIYIFLYWTSQPPRPNHGRRKIVLAFGNHIFCHADCCFYLCSVSLGRPKCPKMYRFPFFHVSVFHLSLLIIFFLFHAHPLMPLLISNNHDPKMTWTCSLSEFGQ